LTAFAWTTLSLWELYLLARDLEFEAAAQTRDEVGKLRERLLAV
jgi:excinuclease ABC subunit B